MSTSLCERYGASRRCLPLYSKNKPASFLSPPGLPRWFTGFCTTPAVNEVEIRVVHRLVSTMINLVALVD